jgi:uncharacterized repeat protein (TIGR01451 family)
MGKFFRRGARRSVTSLAVLALVTGGAFAAFAGTASAHKPSCDDELESAGKRNHHYVLMCKEAPETAVAGTDITYTLTTFASEHKSDEHLFTVEDDLPEGTSLVNVDGGPWDCSGSTSAVVYCTYSGDGEEVDGAVITVTAHVDSSLEEGTEIENCATISLDPKSDEAAAEDYGVYPSTDCADTDITRDFDPSITKTGPDSLVVPGNITYTVTASNSGPSDSDPVSFTDALPAGTSLVSFDGGTAWDCSASSPPVEITCDSIGGIPGNGSISATITLSVPLGHAGTALENCATLTSDTPVQSAALPLESCTSIEGANVTVKAAEVTKPVTGVAPRFTG